jgi:Domain of unknown function (DUF4129)
MHKHSLKHKILPLLLLLVVFTVSAQDDDNVYQEDPVKVYNESNTEKAYESRAFSDSRMGELKNQEDFQYTDKKIQEQDEQNGKGSSDYDYSKKEKQERANNSSSSSSSSYDRSGNSGGAGAWWIILLLFLIVVGIILYSIGFKPSTLFRKNSKNLQPEKENDEHFNEDHIDHIKFESELDKAIRIGNYRLAVRILYLESLKKLNDKQLIDWKINKTNWDYVREVNLPQLKGDFRQITNSFDYVWYGNFPVDESIFKLMQEKIVNFKNKI